MDFGTEIDKNFRNTEIGVRYPLLPTTCSTKTTKNSPEIERRQKTNSLEKKLDPNSVSNKEIRSKRKTAIEVAEKNISGALTEPTL